ncbi:DUF2207 domain-containing protein [Chitinophaga alhagiae]|uniref:DUF2207 domain-containing protein n=1 Tax=Chitinophaga alhagiae TaxID=2203219 RepID=UPI0018E59B6B|nr:DUF2207 domain-containing protein [Chitinophaga alhagiae]
MKKLLLLALLVITVRTATAQEGTPPFSEGILSFHADLRILPTGMLQVTEHIKVITDLQQIRKGIFRTIPVYRRDMYGRKVHVDIRITEVLKNGSSEPYKETEENGELNVRIGNANEDLEAGIYDYEIAYETSGQVGFFDGYDEVYWNVTGNNWQFPIAEASASVTLPPGAQSLQTACYTGPMGATETDCSTANDTSGALLFRTRHLLEPGSGFTVAAGFTPGIIARPPPPTALEKLWDRLMAYKEYALALLGSIIVFCYGFFTWRKHGKDPEKPVVVPTFEPPDGLSPASIRYLYKKTADNTGFTAAIISMAIKKALHIKKDGSQFKLEKGATPANALAPEEQAIHAKLFQGRNSIKVDDAQHRAFSTAQAAYSVSVGTRHNLKSYYVSNTRYMLIGGLITLVILAGYILTVNFAEFFVLLFLAPFIAVGGTLLITGLRSLKKGCSGVFLTMMGAIFTFMPLFFMVMNMAEIPFIAIAFVVALLAAYAWYVYLIRALTPKGAAQLARIEGFMMYLKTAEEHRLNMLTPPEHTPQLFEKLLPYAIALDLENEWGSKFETVLEQAGYSPDWYEGQEIRYSHLSSSFSAGFISSLGRAQVDPTRPSGSSSGGSSSSGSSSWSSGSSGGGSSGGGGGGGGGGGW